MLRWGFPAVYKEEEEEDGGGLDACSMNIYCDVVVVYLLLYFMRTRSWHEQLLRLDL